MTMTFDRIYVEKRFEMALASVLSATYKEKANLLNSPGSESRLQGVRHEASSKGTVSGAQTQAWEGLLMLMLLLCC